MIASSFGGLLKDYRASRGLTQHDVSYEMGWSEPSRLSRIEQGKTKKPNRETVDRLMGILKLDRNERGQLLLAGGYMPTMEEIKSIRKEVKPLLNAWPYPAYLLDFAWRLIALNSYAADMYEVRGETANYVSKKVPISIELIFNPDFVQNKYLNGKAEILQWHKLLLEKLVRFRLMNVANTSEKWYQDFMGRMMKNELFSKLWQKAQQESEERGIADYEHKLVVDVYDTKKRIDLHIMRSSLIQDVRFQMNYHFPGNKETMLRYFSSDKKTE